MSENDRNELDALDDIVQGLEMLRSHVVDLEAMAYAASQTLEHVPNMASLLRKAQEASADSDFNAAETRLRLGRLQALVSATSTTAHSVLNEVDSLLDKAQGTPPEWHINEDGSSDAREPAWSYGKKVVRIVA